MKPLYQRLTVMLLVLMVSFIATIPVASANNQRSVIVYNKKTNKDYTFTSVAVENLSTLRDVVAEMGIKQHLETLQSIMMVETRAGTGGQIGLPKAHPSRRSYGVMQLTVPTARVLLRNNAVLKEEVFGSTPLSKIKDADIIKVLLNNVRVNIQLGAMLFTQYYGIVHNEWARAVAGYNMGIGNALKRKHAPQVKYVADVKTWMPMIASFNQMNEIPVEHPEPSVEDMVRNLPNYKENDNGKTEEANSKQGADCEQGCEQFGRAEEVQDNSGNNYALFATD